MKKIIAMCICTFLFLTTISAQNQSASEAQSFGPDFVQGLEAYRTGEWEDALFFLKRTSNFQNASSDAVWYFVIMAEMYLADYEAVLRDGTTFLEIFQDSSYKAEITYQTLYASFELGYYDQAILGFTDFVTKYPNHMLAASAVYFTGEALYNVYEFEGAKVYFDRIVVDFPTSEKYEDALFRLELLKQREREEKLLYLLRVTGEEAVAAREDYERQIKQLQSEESLILGKRVQELEQSVNRLQVEKVELELQNENLRRTVQDLNTVIAENTQAAPVVDVENSNSLIDSLSARAIELERLLDE